MVTEISPGSVRRGVQHDGKVRILLLCNSVQMGGMEEHVRMLAEELDRDCFTVFAVTPDWEPTAAFTAAMARAADYATVNTPDRRSGLFRQLRDSIRLIRHVRRERIDVVHMHSTGHRGENLAAICSWLGGADAVYISEHLAPAHRLAFFERGQRNFFSERVSGIVCVSAKNHVERSRWITTPPHKTVVVPNGVDTSRFHPTDVETRSRLRLEHQIPEDATVIGTAVRFEAGKGLDVLIDAFAALHRTHPATALLMVGDGKLRDQLVGRVESLGCSAAVHFVGFQDDVRPFLAIMDVFVLTVPVGSMSIGLLEAMATGLPSVITFGGEGEAVVHGENGFCAEPGDPESVAGYLAELVENPQRRAAFGHAARQRVIDHYSSQRVASSLAELYLNGPSAVPKP